MTLNCALKSSEVGIIQVGNKHFVGKHYKHVFDIYLD